MYNQQPMMQPPPQKSNTLKIVLIVFAVLAVLGFGACGACALVAGSVGKNIADSLGDGGGMFQASPKAVQDELAGAKSNYVGEWASKAGSTLSIGPAGTFSLNIKEGGVTKNFNGVSIAAFNGNNIAIKVFVTINFDVSKPPTKSGSGAELVLDGITFVKE